MLSLALSRMRCFIGLMMVVAVFPFESVNASELTSENNKKLKRVLNVFPKSDTDGDNILTMSELHDLVKAKLDDSATSKTNLRLKKLLKEEQDSDKNGDGVLTKAELLAHLR